MKKLIILLTTASLFVACNNKKKSDGEANASMIEASQNGSLKQEQSTPHMLIINYNLKEMSIEEHSELGTNVAPNFTPEKIEGLIGKSFIGNTNTGVYGGAYQFSSNEAAEKYITSEFWLGIEAHPNLVNFIKEIYGIAPISTISNGIPML